MTGGYPTTGFFFDKFPHMLAHIPVPGHRAAINSVFLTSRSYMSQPRFDASHDFAHVLRVVGLALHIASFHASGAQNDVRPITNNRRSYKGLDLVVLICGALLHDVSDHKYTNLQPDESHSTRLTSEMQNILSMNPGAVRTNITVEQEVAIAALIKNVSYSNELRTPAAVAEQCRLRPELAIVQDADRLDALGAVGIARCFTYGAVKGNAAAADRTVVGDASTAARGRDLGACMGHFDEKLFRLVDMMKTDEGRRMARERTYRLAQFKEWWREETGTLFVAENCGCPTCPRPRS